MQPRLTFEILDLKIEEYIKRDEKSQPGRGERIAFVTGFAAVGVALFANIVRPPELGLVLATSGLVVEIVSFAVAILLMIRREWHQFRRQRRAFSQELEADYVTFRKYVAWLRTYPAEEIAQRLRYLQSRRNMMVYRLGALTGGVERLGILPVVVALYFQFKDWRWGDWSALLDVNWVSGILLWAALLVYAGGWWIIRLKSRLDSYEALLTEATMPLPEGSNAPR
jgi:hypothetical protein